MRLAEEKRSGSYVINLRSCSTTEHGISIVQKIKIPKNTSFALKLSDVVFILLINVKMTFLLAF